MDHFKILKRAFRITADYRVLWVFGILLALTTAGGSGGNGGDNGTQFQPGMPNISPEVFNGLIIAGVTLACVIFILSIVGIFIRYISETALIKMVDGYEANNEKVTWRQGFRLGWSRASFRLFLADLVIGLSVFIVAVLSLLIAATPLLVWVTHSTPARVLGTVLAIGMLVLVVLSLIVVGIVLSLLIQFIRRAIVLENLGVFEGMRRGVAVLRQHLGDSILMGLILFGMHLVWAILMIPVFILLAIVAALVGGLPALLVWAIVNLFASEAVAGIAAAIVGVPLAILVIAGPTLFLNGLKETYISTTWTLTYREFMALEASKPPVAPEPTPPAEVAPPVEVVPPVEVTTSVEVPPTEPEAPTAPEA